MMKKLLFVSVVAIMQTASFAQTPDWATGVAPILYNHCTGCHHDNGIAPFSLLTYNDAQINATSTAYYTGAKIMPPWPPDPTYSHMAHERVISAADIATIAAWVSGGSPEGNPALAPPTPVYSNSGMIPGTPDLVVRIPTYTSTASTSDVYQCFVVPSGLLADKFITAFEAVPGNAQAVHHVLVYADTTGTCAALQAASTTPPGYPDFGGVGSSSAIMLGGWVPGSSPMSYPNGFGVKIPHGADIVIQIHYPAGTVGMKDSTEIHFFFTPTTAVRNVSIQPLLYNGIDITPALNIPANTTASFTEAISGPDEAAFLGDMTLLGIAPHMHLLGQNIKSYGIWPSGDTDQYIRINKWDFHWQGFYMLPKLKKIPSGTGLYANAYYDNTAANPNNPNSPPRNVSAGEQTTDEMMLVFFVLTPYQAGDENIIVDSAVVAGTPQQLNNYYHGQQLLDVCPNPAVSNLIVKCFMEDPEVASITLVDMDGKVVRQFMDNGKVSSGYSAITYSVSGLPAGTYSLEMRTTQRILTQKIVVIH